MTILHVRNVPETLYERLRRRAETQRRSLSAEVITLLTRALDEEGQASEVTLAAIRSRRCFDPAAAGAPDSAKTLREDRGPMMPYASHSPGNSLCRW